MASHQTFPAKLRTCPAKSNLARQIFIHYEWKFMEFAKENACLDNF